MEHEIMEETLSGNSTEFLENKEDIPFLSPDVLPDKEIVKNGKETASSVPENKDSDDTAVSALEENTEGTEENIYEMEHGNEN